MKNLIILSALLLLNACKIENNAVDPLTSIQGKEGFNYKQSIKKWKSLKEINGNSYEYETTISSWSGFKAVTTIKVINDKVVQRSYQATLPNTEDSVDTTQSYIENEDELGTHPNGTDAVTIDYWYNTCAAEFLSVNIEENTLYFETNTDGQLTVCGFVPEGCMDDCFTGVRISSFEWINTENILISNDAYINAPSDHFQFLNAEIKNDSLYLRIEYGGGCGDIELKLIASEDIMESHPVQQNIRLSFSDNDFCKALIRKNIAFNLKPVQASTYGTIQLNLLGWKTPLIYKY